GLGREIRHGAEHPAILVEQLYTFIRTQPTGRHLLPDEVSHSPVQVVGVVLNERELFLHRRTGQNLFDVIRAGLILVGEHVDLRHAPEEIVHIPHDVLVGTHEEEAQVVRLIRADVVQFEVPLIACFGDELVHLAVRIARQIYENSAASRRLVETMYRDNRKSLSDGPVIDHRAEYRKVAVIVIDELGRQSVERSSALHRIRYLRPAIDFHPESPVELLEQRLVFYRQRTASKGARHFGAELPRV